MKTIYEHIRGNALLSVLWSAAYNDKKLSKSTIRAFEMHAALTSVAEIKDFKLNFVSRFVVGLVRVYFLKYRLVYEDFHTILSERKIKARKKLFKALPLRPITVDVGETTADDEKVNGSKREIVLDGDNEVMEPSVTSADNFEVGYSTIEELRESTGLNATVAQIAINPDKRRRNVLDLRIEYDAEFFDQKVRGVKDLLRREDTRKGGIASILGIQPEIIQALMEQRIQAAEHSIEMARGQSMTDMSYDAGYADAYMSSKHSEPSEAIFSLYNLPDVFTFDSVVQNFTKRDKACSFMALLTLINNSQVVAEQGVPYGPIECRVL